MFKHLLGLATVGYALPMKDFETFEQFWFTQKQDHFNKSNRTTFQQRYWRSDKYLENEKAPVFVYICGESECHAPSEKSFYMDIADEFEATVYSLEHRYYGSSQPVEDWSTENMKYLNSQQGLEDLATFIQTLKDQDKEDRKYLVIGGSYPGALSAWFRYKYPHLADFSWASSGVINAIPDMWQQDEILYQDTLKSGEFCPHAIRRVMNYAEKHVLSAMQGDPNSEAQSMMDLFGTEATEGMQLDEFMFFIADIFISYVQYGQRTELCKKMEAAPVLDTLDLMRFTAFHIYQGGVEDYKTTTLRDTKIVPEHNYRQWTWQYCNEFGFFQTPSKIHRVRSTLVGIHFWQDYCKRIFELDDYIYPDTYGTNAHYGATDLRTSYTIFVNGGEDVWQPASMTQDAFNSDWASKNEVINLLADCDDCGHCGELRGPRSSDPKELQEVRETISKTLHRWIDQE